MGIKLGDHIKYDIKNWISEEEAEKLFKAAGYVELNKIDGYKVIKIKSEDFDEGNEDGLSKETEEPIKRRMRIKVNISSERPEFFSVENVLEDAIEELLNRKQFKSYELKGVV